MASMSMALLFCTFLTATIMTSFGIHVAHPADAGNETPKRQSSQRGQMSRMAQMDQEGAAALRDTWEDLHANELAQIDKEGAAALTDAWEALHSNELAQMDQEVAEALLDVWTMLNASYGLGGHTLNLGTNQIELTEGARIVDTEEGLKNYANSGRGLFQGRGCTVTKEEGFFVVHYDERAASQGCAIDLVTRDATMANRIAFWATVTEPKGLLGDKSCLTYIDQQEDEYFDAVHSSTNYLAYSENVVPFAYSLNNGLIGELSQGPRYTSDKSVCTDFDLCRIGTLLGKCIELTALEVKWFKLGSAALSEALKGDLPVEGILYPVGDMPMAVLADNMTRKKNGNGTNVVVEAEFGEVEIGADGLETVLKRNVYCLSNKHIAIPVPKAWPIANSGNSTVGLKEGRHHLLTFHLLPQCATRQYTKVGSTSYRRPKGTPKCMGQGRSMAIKFSADKYSGILLTPLPMKTTTMAPVSGASGLKIPLAQMDQEGAAALWNTWDDLQANELAQLDKEASTALTDVKETLDKHQMAQMDNEGAAALTDAKETLRVNELAQMAEIDQEGEKALMDTWEDLHANELAQSDQEAEEALMDVWTLLYGTYGLGGHTLNTANQIELAEGARIVDTEEGLKEYANSGRGLFQGRGCKVTKEEGFFVVHYDERAASEGCAVDLVTRDATMANRIAFWATVTEPKGLLGDNSCLTDTLRMSAFSDNIVPFAYSLNNGLIGELRQGPRYATDEDSCPKLRVCQALRKCIEFTALEIKWVKKFLVQGALYPIGDIFPDPLATNATRNGSNVESTTGEIEFDSEGLMNMLREKVNCLPAPTHGHIGVPVPKTWPIANSGNLNLGGGQHLLTFHLLPQNATRDYSGLGLVSDKMPVGTPKCMGQGRSMAIKFSTDKYSGILLTPLPGTKTATMAPVSGASSLKIPRMSGFILASAAALSLLLSVVIISAGGFIN